ncbi:MAG: hypothetical protein ABJO27_22690 [Pseudoruegeria sp.]
MKNAMRDPLCDVIDNALDRCDLDDAHSLLFGFSYTVLCKLYPEFVERDILFSVSDLEALREEHRGKEPLEVFPAANRGTNSRKSLIMNLFQAIQENSDLDSVAELIYGLWETLVREEYSKAVIRDVFDAALKTAPLS